MCIRDRAKGVLEHIFSGEPQSGVDSLKWMDASAIAGGLRDEHPQVVALVLSSLQVEQAAQIVNLLPAGLRDEALLRVATLEEAVSYTHLDVYKRQKLMSAYQDIMNMPV